MKSPNNSTIGVMIKVMKPKLPEYFVVEKYLRIIDQNGVYSNHGPLVEDLEYRLSKFFNVNKENLVVCSSATLGLQGACFLNSAKNFLVPTFTFAASALAIRNSGKKISLCDVDEKNWRIQVNDYQESRHDGILCVLPFGANIDFSKYNKFKNVVFDAAASIGNLNLDLTKLNRNHSVVFSLHATKVLGIGEGGVVIFGDPINAELFRSYINFGFHGTRQSRIFGTNAKMSEIQAAYGHAALDLWENEKEEWLLARKNVIKIESEFPNLFKSNLDLNISPYWISCSDENYKIRIKESLNRRNIESRDWWSEGLHKMPIFNNSKIKKSFTTSDNIAARTLGLPFYRGMGKIELEQIHSALQNVK